jgi:hypothetical protein
LCQGGKTEAAAVSNGLPMYQALIASLIAAGPVQALPVLESPVYSDFI